MNDKDLIKSLKDKLAKVEEDKKNIREYRRLYYINYRKKNKEKLNEKRRNNYIKKI